MDGSGKEERFHLQNTATTFLTSDCLHTGLTRQFQSSLKNTAQRENDLAIAINLVTTGRYNSTLRYLCLHVLYTVH